MSSLTVGLGHGPCGHFDSNDLQRASFTDLLAALPNASSQDAEDIINEITRRAKSTPSQSTCCNGDDDEDVMSIIKKLLTGQHLTQKQINILKANNIDPDIFAAFTSSEETSSDCGAGCGTTSSQCDIR